MARVLFDAGPLTGGTLFTEPRAVIRAETADEVPHAFDRMQAAQADGFWLAGAAAYELGHVLDAKLSPLMPEGRGLPLLQFGVFDAPVPAPALAEGGTLSEPVPVWNFERYAAAFDQVQAYIAAGDIYQANLTFPLSARLSGSVDGVYARLRARQPVPHGALVDLGGSVLLSRSPELFFELTADGKLTTRPMKGTMPRGGTVAEDDALRAALAASEKNRAENLMIVDLLRNDMSRISEVGSVQVPDLFTVERFETLHQMTSRITSRIRSDLSLAGIFAALFPCGSITGAPKIRAMEILSELEGGSRDAYCGSIGWIAPNGAMTFNVAIRTLTVQSDGAVRLDVGGGVVFDSTAEDEWAEALLKARFAALV
ncbi:aminodeoxychorismate synthase component I [Jannaschia sp. M317]|uniref:aminodeoxychorismate synthase component I n=1 Tax=Jannaschia sp. M317 TaxID=2867011 RepID=UPI0021A8B583|nr:aminodeoxychorismate synthase component I [Jannaschia sp. M317]UWQ17950.1 aminodeoxychorismate synthase component I [Jannaschia sp. M317]